MKLFNRFDSLGDDFETQVMGQVDNRAENHPVVAVVVTGDVFNESPVDLDPVDRQFAQISQRRISDAKIVERYRIANIFEAGQDLDRLIQITNCGCLCDLKLNACTIGSTIL